jgi:hypothetical protein
MDLASVATLGLVVSLVLSAMLAVVILPPLRSVLRRSCPTSDAVSFWTRFTILMLFLGPLIVTLIFGVPYTVISIKLSTTDLIIRVVTSALVGSFLTLGGIGIRMGSLRPTAVPAPPGVKKTDDELLR